MCCGRWRICTGCLTRGTRRPSVRSSTSGWRRPSRLRPRRRRRRRIPLSPTETESAEGLGSRRRCCCLFGDEPDLADVHDRALGFLRRADLERERPGALDLERARGPLDEVLEVARVFDGVLQRLTADDDLDRAPALPFSTALEEEHLVGSRLRRLDLPLAPVILVGPVPEGVLVRLGLVAEEAAVTDGVVGREGQRAVVAGLGDDGFSGGTRLPFHFDD